MTLREALTFLRHQSPAITAAALAGLAVAAVLTLLAAPAYTATARVYFATHAPGAAATSVPDPVADGASPGTSPNVFLITTSDLRRRTVVTGAA